MAEASELDASAYEVALFKAQDRADKIRKNEALTKREKKKLLAGIALQFSQR